MIPVDTSVWLDHVRSTDQRLDTLLAEKDVLEHSFVTGEIACGSPPRRAEVIDFLSTLPQAVLAEDTEVMRVIEMHALGGIGIGFIDAHLLAATMLTDDAKLWTRDKRLAAAATRLGTAA